jgi:hypothetical protein
VTELPTPTPGTSSLNFPIGDTRANGITAVLSPGGTVAILFAGTSSSTSNLILDVTGYFE